MNNEELKLHAKNIRKNIIREVSNAKCGHPGGALGAADILTILFMDVMDMTKENAGSKDRDRFVLSKGHSSPLLYGCWLKWASFRKKSCSHSGRSTAVFRDIRI